MGKARGIGRRTFVSGVLGAAGATGWWAWGNVGRAPSPSRLWPEDWNPERPLLVTGKQLVVQPVLMYATFQRREKTSWRSWGKINNPEAAAQEAQRIEKELAALGDSAGFPLEVRPLVLVTTAEQAKQVHQTQYDVMVIYAATGSAGLLTACFPARQPADAIVFVRHESGPTYYWYEAIGTRVLRTPDDPQLAQNSAAHHGPVTVDDVVVDDYEELRWRLRGLYALKNFVGQRIVALGGPQGKYDAQAPQVARAKYRLDIVPVSYEELAKRLESARTDSRLAARLDQWTNRYLALPGTTLETQRPFVVNAFLLYVIFKQWMREHQAPTLTINACMGTIIPMAETTACLTLSWLNDEGLLAFCESDFVIIPPGIVLHYVSGQPVFMHNSTFPHKAVVTCAHCTAPRRMDGTTYAPARILTHYESDYGAAPKIEMPVGQRVTFIDPEYSTGRWLGFTGTIKANPFHEICRTQQDVVIHGQWQKLRAEARDSHWMMAYGDHLQPIGYAVRKIGIRWVDLSSDANRPEPQAVREASA